MTQPPCGIYRTTLQIGPIEAGKLVYFHNHGEPGPGIYSPQSWNNNRTVFSKHGTTLDEPGLADTLEPLAAEGLYRVSEEFTCCSKNCRSFSPGMLVQLGYNGDAKPLLFVPHWHADGSLHMPERGFALDDGNVAKLELLQVDRPKPKGPSNDDLVTH
ncbi:MAG: hypothetical protein A2289_16515 [Deltaproteobacteria bacterium RIFOXYA12_FULL_58_15]|nr:MAG: hypothetical protein A2289_16515 [Deltaproteobacteria bacterium RIFOXYA12_FULL_58_15]OGR09084.1 MAG: hypothetical protein A2341_25995 [Deltaproteobacteria bacterium RIFOXYB12_FULL_58_9]